MSPPKNIFSDLMPDRERPPVIETGATFGSHLPAAMIPATDRQGEKLFPHPEGFDNNCLNAPVSGISVSLKSAISLFYVQNMLK